LYRRIRDLEAVTSNEFLNRSTPPITTMERIYLILHQTRGLTVTEDNGATPAVSAGYLVSVDPALVVVVPTSVSKLGATGANALPQLFTAGMLVAVGVGMMLLTRRRRHRRV
jgi:LPXTG-motif cell wall-anchored protein